MWDIIWTKEAEADYFGILSYWVVHNYSETYSIKILKEVEKTEELLSINPYIGQIRKQEDIEVREFLILKNFSIIYKISNIIEIIAFWDNRQNPTSLEYILEAK